MLIARRPKSSWNKTTGFCFNPVRCVSKTGATERICPSQFTVFWTATAKWTISMNACGGLRTSESHSQICSSVVKTNSHLPWAKTPYWNELVTADEDMRTIRQQHSHQTLPLSTDVEMVTKTAPIDDPRGCVLLQFGRSVAATVEPAFSNLTVQ